MTKNPTTYTYSLLVLSLLLITTYIVCVYKTVLIASEHEIQRGNFADLQVTVGEKEHAYIQANTKFDIEEAVRLGYIKTPETHIAFIDLTKDTALAIR